MSKEGLLVEIDRMKSMFRFTFMSELEASIAGHLQLHKEVIEGILAEQAVSLVKLCEAFDPAPSPEQIGLIAEEKRIQASNEWEHA